MMLPKLRYSEEEHARRGKAIYESLIRSQVEEDNQGKIVAIDVDTGAFEIGNNTMITSDRLIDRYSEAQIWCVRVGHKGVHRL